METILQCYKHEWLLQEVINAVSTVSNVIPQTDRLENRVMHQVGQYLLGDERRLNDRNHIRRLIYREVSEAMKRCRKEPVGYTEDLASTREDGSRSEYDAVDESATVEQSIELSETLTLLGRGDERRAAILNAWTAGVTNDAELSRQLSERFGGTSDSQRLFVKRFRKECREQRSLIAI